MASIHVHVNANGSKLLEGVVDAVLGIMMMSIYLHVMASTVNVLPGRWSER